MQRDTTTNHTTESCALKQIKTSLSAVFSAREWYTVSDVSTRALNGITLQSVWMTLPAPVGPKAQVTICA
jgi:hypothetical protein